MARPLLRCLTGSRPHEAVARGQEVGCGRPKGGLAHDEQRKEHKSAELSGIDGRGRHNYGGSRLYGCAQPASSSGGSLASTKGSAAGPIEAVSAPASWDEEADVVVVGTGRAAWSLQPMRRKPARRMVCLGEGEHLGRQLEGDGQLQRHGNQDPAGHLSGLAAQMKAAGSGRSGGAVRSRWGRSIPWSCAPNGRKSST